MLRGDRIYNFLFLLTGFTCLLYEISWQKFLITYTGSDFKGTSTVLGLMLGSMGLGYYYFGKKTEKLSNKEIFKLTAIIEIGIAASAFLFPLLYELFEGILNSSTSDFFLSGFYLEVSLSLALIAPPSFLLGGNLPLITHALSSKSDHEKAHCNLYFYNTLGAFIGALAAAFVLIPTLGLLNTMYFGALVNLYAGYVFYSHSKSADEEISKNLPNDSNDKGDRSLFYLSVAFISGFIAVCLQTVLMRLLALSIGGSEYTFSIVVAVFILCLSLGTKILVERFRLSLNQLFSLSSLGMLAIYLLAPQWAYFFHLIRINLADTIAGFYIYYSICVFTFLVLTFAAIMPLGALLPKLFSLLSKDSESYGSSTGIVYGANSSGYVVGSLLSGYVILEYLNIDNIILILVLLSYLYATYTFLHSREQKKISKPLYLVISAAVLTAFVYQWPEKRQAVGIFYLNDKLEHSYDGAAKVYESLLGDAKVLAHKDGNTAGISVVEFSSDKPGKDGRIYNRSIMINGKSDGNTEGDLETMKLTAYTGALFVDSRKTNNSSAVIGYGTGLTSGTLLKIPWIKNVDTIEISKEVVQFSNYFDFANDNVSANEKHNFIIDDAYHYFARSTKKYELIVSLLSNFWMSGIEKLYTKDFYKLVQKDLAKDGLYVQWLSLWGCSESTAKIAIRTFQESFVDTKYIAYGKTFLLLGKNSKFNSADLETVNRNISSLKTDATFNFINVEDIEEFLMNEVWLPSSALEDAEIQSNLHPILAYQAGKDFYFGSNSSVKKLVDTKGGVDTLRESLLSLNALWSKKHGNSLSANQFYEVLKNRCDLKNIKLIEPDWRYVRDICREALVELMKKGKVRVPTILQEDFKWLESFKANTLAKNRSPKQAQLDISRFATFYSVFDYLSISELRKRIEICYKGTGAEHLKCQQMFANFAKNIN